MGSPVKKTPIKESTTPKLFVGVSPDGTALKKKGNKENATKKVASPKPLGVASRKNSPSPKKL